MYPYRKIIYMLCFAAFLCSCSGTLEEPMVMENQEHLHSSGQDFTLSEADKPLAGTPEIADIERLGEFSEGYFLYVDAANGKYGYINTQGDIAIPPVYDSAHPFSDGCAVVKAGGRFGVIDHEGNYLFQPTLEFTALRNYNEGVAAFQLGGLWGFVDKHGEIVMEAQFEEVSDCFGGVALVADADDYRIPTQVLPSAGEPFMAHKFGAPPALGGSQLYREDGYIYQTEYTHNYSFSSVLHPNGTIIYSTYGSIATFHEDVAVVRYISPGYNVEYYVGGWTKHYETGVELIDREGNLLYQQDRWSIGYTGGAGLPKTLYMWNGWVALLDFSGVPVYNDKSRDWYDLTPYGIEESYRTITDQSIKRELKKPPVMYMNREGEFLALRNYALNHYNFQENRCYVEDGEGVRGYIDTDGVLYIDYALLEKELGGEIVMEEGVHDDPGLIPYGEYSRYFQHGYARIKTEEGYGLIDVDGNIALWPGYEAIDAVFSHNGDTVVCVGGQFIGLDGNLRFEAEIHPEYLFADYHWQPDPYHDGRKDAY